MKHLHGKGANNCKFQLSSKSSREDMCRLPTSFLLNIQSRLKQEVDMPQIQKCVTRYSSPYWFSVPNIRKLASVVPEKNVTEIILWANLPMQCPQYSKSCQTGSGHASDSKMRYTIQFSILMLCANYQEAGLFGSQEKCDRNFLWRRRRKTTDTDSYMWPPLKRAGDTITHSLHKQCTFVVLLTSVLVKGLALQLTAGWHIG